MAAQEEAVEAAAARPAGSPREEEQEPAVAEAPANKHAAASPSAPRAQHQMDVDDAAEVALEDDLEDADVPDAAPAPSSSGTSSPVQRHRAGRLRRLDQRAGSSGQKGAQGAGGEERPPPRSARSALRSDDGDEDGDTAAPQDQRDSEGAARGTHAHRRGAVSGSASPPGPEDEGGAPQQGEDEGEEELDGQQVDEGFWDEEDEYAKALGESSSSVCCRTRCQRP